MRSGGTAEGAVGLIRGYGRLRVLLDVTDLTLDVPPIDRLDGLTSEGEG